MKKATFPVMGEYTRGFKYLIEQLGFEAIVPPKTSQKTIKLGVKHSSDMICFPFKTTLGNLIQGLEAGADTIIAGGVWQDGREEGCRFGYYYYVQAEILRRLGYKFDIYYMKPGYKNIFSLKKISPKLSYFKLAKIVNNTFKIFKEVEKKEFTFEKKKINIGLVGEAYTLWEPGVNYNIIKKLKSLDVGVDMSLTLTWFIKHQVHLADTKKHLHKEARKYFPKRIGGHGWESIINTIDYAKRGFDGVIHLLPLSCMPETIVEMSMNQISDDYNIPIYRFPIDENNFECGFDTRLETFIKLLKRNKK